MHRSDFRDKKLAKKASERMHTVASSMDRIKIMHVCGTHEDTITRFGIRSLLPENVEVISGPGCPVCVTSTGEIDEAVFLAKQDGVILTTFGDMMRVPGSNSTLADVKAEGGDVRVVYSPSDAIRIARANPANRVVHIAIGFETTAPTTAVEMQDAPDNFSILCCHRTIPRAMDLLLASGDVKIDGFIDPGHVSAIIGAKPYRVLAEKYKIPHVIVGFEPLDVLFSIVMLLEMIRGGKYDVENEYSRVVKDEGNKKALEAMDRVFEPCDVRWRGFPVIPGSGLKLRDEYAEHDARRIWKIEVKPESEPKGCRCGDVLKGLIYPNECPLFDRVCTPAKPVGPCMVSIEGSCSIAYKYGR